MARRTTSHRARDIVQRGMQRAIREYNRHIMHQPTACSDRRGVTRGTRGEQLRQRANPRAGGLQEVAMAPKICDLLEHMLLPVREVELRVRRGHIRRGVAQRRAVRAVEFEPRADFLWTGTTARWLACMDERNQGEKKERGMGGMRLPGERTSASGYSICQSTAQRNIEGACLQ